MPCLIRHPVVREHSRLRSRLRGLARAALGGLGLLSLLLLNTVACAQAYPDRPIKLIVPFAAGGGADYFARPLGQKLTQELGESIVVENRGGANGAIGAEAVMQAPADGYTLLFGSAGVMTVGPAVSPKLKYDPNRDFVPIALVANSPFSLIVNPGVGVKSLKEFLAYARAHPGKLRYGSSGIGGAPHLAGELFDDVAKVKMEHVPYRGVGPMLTDLLAGRIDLTFIGGNIVQQYVNSGKLLLLATAGERRSPVTPDVPTMAEAGLPGFLVGTWYGVFAPAGTPPAVITKLNAAINHILGEPEMQQLLAKTGAVPSALSPSEFATFMHTERQKWDRLAKSAHITLE
jgi:tripartite-type tricarboxylate transporter receptor subunit TctC